MIRPRSRCNQRALDIEATGQERSPHDYRTPLFAIRLFNDLENEYYHNLTVHTFEEENCFHKLQGLEQYTEAAPRMPRRNHTEPSSPARSGNSIAVRFYIRISKVRRNLRS
jgi:hypothetical protein